VREREIEKRKKEEKKEGEEEEWLLCERNKKRTTESRPARQAGGVLWRELKRIEAV